MDVGFCLGTWMGGLVITEREAFSPEGSFFTAGQCFLQKTSDRFGPVRDRFGTKKTFFANNCDISWCPVVVYSNHALQVGSAMWGRRVGHSQNGGRVKSFFEDPSLRPLHGESIKQ